MKTKEIKPLIGSQVLEDKETLLSGLYADDIRALLEQRGVLVFPQINFNDEEQLAFTRTLGTVARERTGEEVFPVSLDPTKSSGVEYLKGSFYWHLDGTMQPMPILASLLSAKVLSKTGGNTEFCNTYAAYDALSDEDKKAIESLTVNHSVWSSLLYYEPEPTQEKLDMMMSVGEADLPLVWRHKSGRKSLVLGCTAGHVLDMDPTQSRVLLNRLRAFATSEPFHYSHSWSVGDLVMWDNTGTLHRATPYPLDSGREMHRTKLEGEEPIAA
jgi:alpha-ketoglutarate-dependent taurine dioxygenase